MASIKVGTKFRYTIADGNALWKVTKKVAAGHWDAVCLDEDHKGTVQAFKSEQIQRSLSFDASYERMDKETDNFYDSLTIGRHVHYCNGFKEFVECVVMEQDGKKTLLPIALKGEWRKWDLPHRLPSGEIVHGYHVKKIMEEKTWRPSIGCVVECPLSSYKNVTAEQLANMPRIDLGVPPLDERKEEVAKTLAVLNSISEKIQEVHDAVYQDDETKSLTITRLSLASFLTLKTKELLDMNK
jgi:hypothetical protein